MNSNQQKTLKSLFDNPVMKNIKWTDVEKLIIGVQGRISQGDGSRIVIGEQSLNIHTPHPHKELKPYQIRAIRKLFIEQGLIP